MSSVNPEIIKSSGLKPDIPKDVQIGDFIVAKFADSEWTRYLKWEDWDHAALVTQLNPLKVIEASGIILQKEDKNEGKKEIREGVVEYEFQKPRTITRLDGTKNPNGNLWMLDSLLKAKWLRPVFPDPIHETDKWYVRTSKRKIITEQEARSRAVVYVRDQLGDPFSIAASKWNESKWYCSLLIYKSYSRTVTGMYLETYGRPYDFRAGPTVTPEDLVDSPFSEEYFEWEKSK